MTSTSHRTPRTRFLLSIAAVAAIAATAGCSGSGSDGDADSDSGGVTTSDERAAAPAGDSNDVGADPGMADGALVDGSRSAPEGEPAKQLEIEGNAVISTGTVSLEDEDVSDARIEVRKVIDKYRGTLAEQETSTGDEGEVTYARLVVRVPSARFADAMLDLEGIATLVNSDSSGQDVSTEVVDVEARIRAQRKSVSRIESLLARAESLDQIVTIESQLSSRQAELDSLLARQTYLADQTSQSTITVHVEQPDGEVDDEEETADGFLGGLQDGWDSFVSGFAAVLTVVGFALPWLALLLLVGIPARVLLRRRGRATA